MLCNISSWRAIAGIKNKQSYFASASPPVLDDMYELATILFVDDVTEVKAYLALWNAENLNVMCII
jgi:hypothetical protein